MRRRRTCVATFVAAAPSRVCRLGAESDSAPRARVPNRASPLAPNPLPPPRMRRVIEAVPGAGKTRLLRRMCEEDGVPSLFLAYNTQLAAEVAPTLPEGCVCLTFHALCGRCLGVVARDDAQLEEAVERAERGELAPRDVPPVRRVLIDEAQDVRPLYARLVRAVGLARDDVAIVAAGDRHQLVYDFDPDFPASLDLLLRPEALLGGGPWERALLATSHRLTPPVAALVNAVFGTAIASAGDGAGGGGGGGGAAAPEVEVRAPRTAFALHEALRDVLTAEAAPRTLLLVDRRAGNRPLRALLNELSRAGVPLHLHGVDADEGGAPPGALRCLTYWSAKGLECDTAVVLLPQAAPRNPTYVALTRARRRLVVVLDPREPHAAVCRAVAAAPAAYDVRGRHALAALEAGARGDAEASLRPAERGAPAGGDAVARSGALDRVAPPRALLRGARVQRAPAAPRDECRDALGGGGDGGGEGALLVGGVDVSRAAVAMALVAAEARASGGGRVRAMEEVLHPTRMEPERFAAAAGAGFVGRPVPRFVTDDALLADDLRAAAATAYARLVGSTAALAEVALAVLAWDGFDHVMRQLRPVAAWADDPALGEVLAYALAVLPRDGAEYDTRLYRGAAHVRVHAACAARCYHVVWGRSSADVAAAAVRATLHPRRECLLVDLAAREAHTVHAALDALVAGA